MNHRLLTGSLLVAAILLAACAEKDDKKPATQVAARVNGSEITVHQLNLLLSRLSGIDDGNAVKARREVLDKLIDQQLAVDQAVSAKLDRQPEVMATLEAARREVLSRAYLDSIVAGRAKPSPEEARQYYDQHPELFSQRRIYHLQEILLEKNDGLLPALREKAATAKSMDELAAWLKAQNIRFASQGGERPAEQISLDIIPGLHAAPEGPILVFNVTQGIALIRVIGSKAAAVAREAALPAIQQYLANQHARETVDGQLRQLRQQAKIEFLGTFADKNPPPSATAAPGPATDPIGKAVGALK